MIVTVKYSEAFFHNLSSFRRRIPPSQPQAQPQAQPQPQPQPQVQEPTQFSEKELYLDYGSEAEVPKLGLVEYTPRKWTLQERQDLTQEIDEVYERISKERERQQEILQNEQTYINRAFEAQDLLKRRMEVEDLRAQPNDYCVSEKTNLMNCLWNSTECIAELNQWKGCVEAKFKF